MGIATDKNNRVFTSEMYPGRVQQFRYVTDAEAEQLRKDREEQREKKAGGNSSSIPLRLRPRSKLRARRASRVRGTLWSGHSCPLVPAVHKLRA